MNHSCFPNVVYMSDKRHFRALRKIKKGEELLHSYLGRELLLPTELRRRLLWRSKCFECQCERCVAEEDPMRRVSCAFCAEALEQYQVSFSPGIWLRSEPSVQGKQLAFLPTGTRLQGKGEVKQKWICVEAESVGSVGWVLLDGRALVPPLRQMLCVRIDTSGTVCCDAFDGTPLSTWPGRRLWHLAASLLLPPDDVQTPVVEDETEEEAFTRDVLDQLHTEKFLPCAAFEEGSAQCSFHPASAMWRCDTCGKGPEASFLATERLLGRLAERTFFSPKMTPALGNVSGGGLATGASLKMVKRLFVRQAFELSSACAVMLGQSHWSVQWARLFLVDLAISRLSYGTGRGKDLGLLMCEALQELWKWLKTLHLSHDPSCFLLTRTKEAQRLLGNDPCPEVQEQLQRLRTISSSCTKQVDILPLRPLIIDGREIGEVADDEHILRSTRSACLNHTQQVKVVSPLVAGFKQSTLNEPEAFLSNKLVSESCRRDNWKKKIAKRPRRWASTFSVAEKNAGAPRIPRTPKHRNTERVEKPMAAEVKVAAQKLFGCFLRLAFKSRLLDSLERLQDVGLQDGDTVTAVAQTVHVAATQDAVAWGDACEGGDTSTVEWKLRSAAAFAFAAITGYEGQVVSWGEAESGGDCAEVRHDLKDVRQLQASYYAFAAIKGDGTVVTWGWEDACSSDSSEVQEQLVGVREIQSTFDAFAAILQDGSVVTWGDPCHGGDSTDVQGQLRNVTAIQATSSAFAAILADGSVVSWGSPAHGGDSTSVNEQLKDVSQIQATKGLSQKGAFAAILRNGAVETGGDSTAVQDELMNVQQIQSTASAFCAIADGRVVTWGAQNAGGDIRAKRLSIV
eukprot:symbB.v1.2.002240.t1/scaffold118.1/size318305/12